MGKKLKRVLIVVAMFFLILGYSGCSDDKGAKNSADNEGGKTEADITAGDDDTAKGSDEEVIDGSFETKEDKEVPDSDEEETDDEEIVKNSVDCTEIPELPIQFETMTGFTGSEDFVFDSEGNMISVEMSTGNLVKQKKDASKKLFVPGLGETAGTRMLKNGDIVIASVDKGSLLKITSEGSMETIASGLSYPNGVEVDLQDNVYVSEQEAGTIRKIDPVTGTSDLIAEGMHKPNGLSFSTDYKTLYCVSFGAGILYAIRQDENGVWQKPEVYGKTPDAPKSVEESCEGKSVGDTCSTYGRSGKCEDIDGELECAQSDGCSELGEGAPCSDYGYMGSCKTNGAEIQCDVEEAFNACSGKSEGDDCEVAGAKGKCQKDDFGGDDGYDFLFCGSSEGGEDGDGEVGMEENGGLDGLRVDACGYIYVTEYVVGKVWRFTPDGKDVELLINPGTSWVPNMHWGNGVGGWDENTLYVMDREGGNLFTVPLGIPSKNAIYK